VRFLRNLADSGRAGSAASRFRRRRIDWFEALLGEVPPPRRVVDVGGMPEFWERHGYAGRADVDIVVLNLFPQETAAPNIRCVVGDATAMPEFADGSFDVAFSNSVIEHVGSLEQQRRMAAELRRVAPRYFVQTPNRYFPIEPHFLFPGFQFLPFTIQVGLLRTFPIGWNERVRDPGRAAALVREIRLMSERELRSCFPGGRIARERFLGLTKSFVAYGGWRGRLT
jgi:hypothetical protein